MGQAPTPSKPPGETDPPSDPSMDDILASIRRILSDEEKAAKTHAPSDGVLRLDPSMMVDDEGAAMVAEEHDTGPMHDRSPHGEPAYREPELESRLSVPPAVPASVESEMAPPAAEVVAPAEGDGLIAPAAAAMAASSVGALMRTLMSERQSVVHRGGPSIEDLVREEIRPLLKGWLDQHLPNLVERLVRTEIERVVGRITG